MFTFSLVVFLVNIVFCDETDTYNLIYNVIFVEATFWSFKIMNHILTSLSLWFRHPNKGFFVEAIAEPFRCQGL